MSLSAKYAKGIEIEIGGNATKLKTALDDTNRAIKTTQTELTTLKNSLTLKWDASNFKRAQELSQRAIQETAQKADALKQALAKLEKAGISKDNSAQYENIRRELSYVQIDAQKAQEELAKLNTIKLDSLQKSISSAAGKLSGMGSKLTAGLTLPLAMAGGAAIKYSKDTQEAINKVEVAFGYAAEGVKNWSNTTLSSYGLAKGTALDMAALFGDMATSMGYSQAEAADMSKTLVELAADLASFKNISIDQANTALESIFTGEIKSMKMLGVVMTETNLKAFAMANGFETAYDQMGQAEKIMVRYQYVLANTKNSQGDFARTSDQTANQLRILQESLKELAATAGEDLLPVITPIIAKINDLLQSFGDLDDGTRKLIVQTTLFLATVGPAMKVTGGLAAAASACVTVYKALTVAQAASSAAQTGLNIAMAANPIGAIITAVGALVAVVGSFAGVAALTKEKQDDLTKSLQASKESYLEEKTAIEEKNADTLSMIGALETLAETENKTVAQKESILSLVNQLNEAVPNLSLAYDTQTDSLNMTAEAVRKLAQAEMERELQKANFEALVDLYKIQAKAAAALKDAENKLPDAESAHAAAVAEVENQVRKFGVASSVAAENESSLGKEVENLKRKFFEQREILADTNQEIDALSGKYGDATLATSGLTDEMNAATESTANLSAAIKDQSESVRALVSDSKLLSDAFAEQSASGGLSLDTMLKLIDAGYATAISIDAETGMARLNAEAYMTMASAKIEEQIAGASTSAREASARAMDLEAQAARNASNGIYDLAIAKAAEAASAKEEAAVASANVAALQALKNGIGKVVTGNWSSAPPRGSGSSQREKSKTPDEKAVENYKKASEELEKIRGRNEISQSTYYNRLSALRDKYLKKDSGAWKDATFQLKGIKADMYAQEMDDQKYFLDMGLISENDYYQKMSDMREKYLAKDSDEWKKANTELYGYLDRCHKQQLQSAQASYNAQLDALKDGLDSQKDALSAQLDAQKEAAKSAYETQKEAIDRELELEKKRLGVILEGIDAEVQARRELREDENQDDVIAAARKRLEAAKAQLLFARTDEDRAQWEKEIVRLQQALDQATREKEDTAFYREKEQEKELVQDQISAAEDVANKALEAAEKSYNAAVERLESDYNANVARLEREYSQRVSEIKEWYQATAERLEAQFATVGGIINGNTGKSAGKSAAKTASVAAATFAGVREAAQSVSNVSQSNHVENHRAANVTINRASSLTEGQVVNVVKKLLDQLDR